MKYAIERKSGNLPYHVVNRRLTPGKQDIAAFAEYEHAEWFIKALTMFEARPLTATAGPDTVG